MAREETCYYCDSPASSPGVIESGWVTGNDFPGQACRSCTDRYVCVRCIRDGTWERSDEYDVSRCFRCRDLICYRSFRNGRDARVHGKECNLCGKVICHMCSGDKSPDTPRTLTKNPDFCPQTDWSCGRRVLGTSRGSGPGT